MVIDESSAIIPPHDECRHYRKILAAGLEGLPCPSCSGNRLCQMDFFTSAHCPFSKKRWRRHGNYYYKIEKISTLPNILRFFMIAVIFFFLILFFCYFFPLPDQVEYFKEWLCIRLVIKLRIPPYTGSETSKQFFLVIGNSCHYFHPNVCTRGAFFV